VQLFLYILC